MREKPARARFFDGVGVSRVGMATGMSIIDSVSFFFPRHKSLIMFRTIVGLPRLISLKPLVHSVALG